MESQNCDVIVYGHKLHVCSRESQTCREFISDDRWAMNIENSQTDE